MSIRPLVLSPTSQSIKRNWYIKPTDEDDLFVLNTMLGLSDYYILTHLEIDLNSGKEHFSFWREEFQQEGNENRMKLTPSSWKCRLYDIERIQFHCKECYRSGCCHFSQ